jgi:hypothetical protein
VLPSGRGRERVASQGLLGWLQNPSEALGSGPRAEKVDHAGDQWGLSCREEGAVGGQWRPQLLPRAQVAVPPLRCCPKDVLFKIEK